MVAVGGSGPGHLTRTAPTGLESPPMAICRCVPVRGSACETCNPMSGRVGEAVGGMTGWNLSYTSANLHAGSKDCWPSDVDRLALTPSH